MNIAGLFLGQATARPRAPALRTPAGDIAYGQLLGRVAQAASGLVAAGLKPGDVVGLHGNSTDFVTGTLAVAWAGGASVNVLAGDRAAAKAAGATMFVTSVPDKAAGDDRTFVLDELVERGRDKIPVVQRRPGDVWRIGFSSGTTGERKPVQFTHAGALAKNRIVSELPVLGEYTLVNLGFAIEFAATYWLRELTRGTMVEIAMEAAPAAQALERGGIELMVTSPGNALAVVEQLRTKGIAARPKTLLVGGAPLSEGQRRKLRRDLCPNLWVSYGSTETGLIAMLSPKLMQEDPECAGRLLPHVEAQALGEDGQPLPAGETGRLRFRSPTVANGYVLREDAGADEREAFRGGWFHSRDVGRVDAQGRIYLSAREDDVLNVQGEKILPSKIETVIAKHEGVDECAVVQSGNALVAFVAGAGEVDADSVVALCREGLPAAQVPHRIVQLDALPRNEGGKVMRRELVARAGGAA